MKEKKMIEFLIMLKVFFKTGCLAIGGGLATIPILKAEVISRGWMTETEFIDMIGIAQSTPGPIGINVATYIGFKQYGILGAVAVSFAEILPAFIIIIIISGFYKKYKENKDVKKIFWGIRSAVIGMIAYTGLEFLFLSLKQNSINWYNMIDLKGVLIALIILVAIKIKKVNPIICILMGAFTGLLIY
jgi:chromate transporter